MRLKTFCNRKFKFRSTRLPRLARGWLTGAALGTLAFPANARAVQLHGPPEGLYVHMLAHVFFFAALIFLLRVLKQKPLGKNPGWRYFKLAILFFLFWNTDTFIVHWLYIRLPDTAIIGNSLWDQRLAGPFSLEKWIYYIGRFDHLLCVPAIFFLSCSLKRFCREAEARHRREMESGP